MHKYHLITFCLLAWSLLSHGRFALTYLLLVVVPSAAISVLHLLRWHWISWERFLRWIKLLMRRSIVDFPVLRWSIKLLLLSCWSLKICSSLLACCKASIPFILFVSCQLTMRWWMWHRLLLMSNNGILVCWLMMDNLGTLVFLLSGTSSIKERLIGLVACWCNLDYLTLYLLDRVTFNIVCFMSYYCNLIAYLIIICDNWQL